MPSLITRTPHQIIPPLVPHLQLAAPQTNGFPEVSTPDPMEAVASAYERTNAVRRGIGLAKSFAKAAHIRPFGLIGDPLYQFLQRHPSVAKVLMVSQIFSVLGMIVQLPKLTRQVKRIVHTQGMKRVNAGMKTMVTAGKIVRCFAYLVVGLTAFQLGAKLGKLGLHTLAKIHEATAGALRYIFFASFLLTAAQTFVDGRSFMKTRHFLKTLKAQPWYREDGRYTEKEYQQFKAYVKGMSAKEEKALGRRLGVKGSDVRKNLLEKMRNAVPTGNNIAQMAKDIKLMTGKMKTGQKLLVFSVNTGLVGLTGTICMLFPPLYPLAMVCVSAAGIASLAKMVFTSVNNYRFENSLGLIKRPEGVKAPRDAADYLADYAKWKVGWYKENSLVHRVRNVAVNIGQTVMECVTPLTDTIDAIVAVAAV